MSLENKDALTAPEVASILQIAQNTVYELVKRGELNCYKIGRKMRFTYDDVQAYIEQSRGGSGRKAESVSAENTVRGSRPAQGFAAPIYENTVKGMQGMSSVNQIFEPGKKPDAFQICGQDEILDILAKYMNTQMPAARAERIHRGSYDSLTALYKDEVLAAASHMWDAETDTYNIPYVKKLLPGCPVVRIRVASRSQGFYVASGNPKQISSWEDLQRRDLIIVNREPGAGTRILLDEHLQQMGIIPETIAGYEHLAASHMSVAACVSKGEADLGIGTEKTAWNVSGVEFVPLQMEEYDLIIKKKHYGDPRVQQMIRILQSRDFQEQFAFMKGYDISDMGTVML